MWLLISIALFIDFLTMFVEGTRLDMSKPVNNRNDFAFSDKTKQSELKQDMRTIKQSEPQPTAQSPEANEDSNKHYKTKTTHADEDEKIFNWDVSVDNDKLKAYYDEVGIKK